VRLYLKLYLNIHFKLNPIIPEYLTYSYKYDTNQSRTHHKTFGEKLLNKVSASHCLHNGSFYACEIVNELNKIYFLDCPLKRHDDTRKESVKNKYILTTDYLT